MNTELLARFAQFKDFKLSIGKHDSIGQGACVMELAAHLAGENWTDHPQCVCPVLAAACRIANDSGPEFVRVALRDRIPQLVGTKATNEVEVRRAEALAWYAIRVAALAARAAALAARAADAAARAADAAALAALAARAALAALAAARAADAAARAARAARAAARAADAAADAIWRGFLSALDSAVQVVS